MTVFSREVLTAWAATRGINTALFSDESEWELLDELAALHCANMEIPYETINKVAEVLKAMIENVKGKKEPHATSN